MLLCKRKGRTSSTLNWMVTQPWCSLESHRLGVRYPREGLVKRAAGADCSSRRGQRSFMLPVSASLFTFGQMLISTAFYIRIGLMDGLTPGCLSKLGISRVSNGLLMSSVRGMRVTLG